MSAKDVTGNSPSDGTSHLSQSLPPRSSGLDDFLRKYEGINQAKSVDSLKRNKKGDIKHLTTMQKVGNLFIGLKPNKKVEPGKLIAIRVEAKDKFDNNARDLKVFQDAKDAAKGTIQGPLATTQGLAREGVINDAKTYVKEHQGEQAQLKADQAHLEQFMARIDLVSSRKLLTGD
jgi:hypothetical protein